MVQSIGTIPVQRTGRTRWWRSSNVYRFLVAPFLVASALTPWILSCYAPAIDHSIFPGASLHQTVDHYHQQASGNLIEERYLTHSCSELFGKHQIFRNGTCLYHALLGWAACEIGSTVTIRPDRIGGSMGGEAVSDVFRRPENDELLDFGRGSLMVEGSIPQGLVESVDPHMKHFLQSAISLEHDRGRAIKDRPKISHLRNSAASTTSEIVVTLLVHRGNYANPCMALLTIYNVYIILEHYYGIDWGIHPTNGAALSESGNRTEFLQIIWLDGHAHSELDSIWEQLFGTKPIHVKQLGGQMSLKGGILESQNSSTVQSVQLVHAMVVNTMSAIGDEGLGMYDYALGGTSKAGDIAHAIGSMMPSKCLTNSTLAAFRNFVLNQYGFSRHRKKYQNPVHQKAILTLLVRKEGYVAHPRSTGRADRTLTDVDKDVAYLQSMYPSHVIQVVSFEGVPFEEQLRQVISTDVFVAVHGAGNVHVLWLPQGATFVEFIPKNFRRRRRFRYLAECLGIHYVAKAAWIEKRVSKGHDTAPGAEQKYFVQVRLRPETPFEEANQGVP